MENMRMPELKALVRERGLRGYSQLRKAELIAFPQNNEHRWLLGNQIDCHPHPHPHRWLLGNQIDLHRCLPPSSTRGSLLGNCRGNHGNPN